MIRPKTVTRALAICVAMTAFGSATSATAHSLALAAVQLDIVGDERIHLTLKVPRVGRAPADLRAVVSGCQSAGTPSARQAPRADILRWELTCPGGLEGRTLRLIGLGRDVNEAFVTVRDSRDDAASSWTAIIGANDPRLALSGAPTASAAEAERGPPVSAYFVLGVGHILGGPDHLLFVLGLVLVLLRRAQTQGRPLRPRALIVTLTAFTLAHSVTLALSSLGLLRLPPAPVELVIALSILLLGVELTKHASAADTLTYRHPGFVAFGFGLLHGFGFAGALADVGLPTGAAAPALLLFNLGVEAGQLAFVALVLTVRLLARGLDDATKARARAMLANGIGVAAAYWVIARLADLVYA